MKKILVRLINNREPVAVIDGSFESNSLVQIYGLVDELISPKECEYLEININQTCGILFNEHFVEEGDDSVMDYTATLGEAFGLEINEHFCESEDFTKLEFK